MLIVTYLFHWDVIFQGNPDYIYVFVPSWNITYIFVFHQGTLHICGCAIKEHYIYVCATMEHYIYVFVPSWQITYMCLFHHGKLHICLFHNGKLHICLFHHDKLHICVFPSWHFTYMCLFHHGTLHICVCSIMANYIYVFVP